MDASDTIPFGYIAQVAVRGGRVVVLDQLLQSVTVLDTAGIYITSFGRKGRGPGEFDSPQRMTITGDTIVVKDDRLHLFKLNGELLRTISERSFRRYDAIVSTSRGLVLQYSKYDVPAGAARQIRTKQFALYGLSSDSIKDLVGIVDTMYQIGLSSYTPIPFHPPRAFAWSQAGTLFMSVGDSFHLIVQGTNGDTIERFAKQIERIPISSTDRGDLLDRLSKASEWPRHKINKVVKRAQGDKSALRPVIGALIVGQNDQVMVLRSDLSPRPYRRRSGLRGEWNDWILLDADFNEISSFSLPYAFRPMHLARTAIYGVTTLEDSSTVLVRYNLPAR